MQLSASNIPHEADTDDIAFETNPIMYDSHHSKQWNEEVNKRAEELENEMKIQENIKIAKQKAKEEAERKAAEEQAKAADERRK